MPIKNARYRVKKTSRGPVRLALRGNTVIETKNMKTGAMRTQAEFRRERRKGEKGKKVKGSEPKVHNMQSRYHSE